MKILNFKMSQIFKAIEVYFKVNAIKSYLILVNIILVIFGIWFSNAGLLPFVNISDFLVFALLSLILAIYRPSWTFAMFIGTIALENINLMPKNIGLAIRPYQFFGFVTIIALIMQMVSKRLAFSLPKWKWYDVLPILFALSGFISSFGAVNRGVSFKQAVVSLSFAALYFLARIFVQSIADLKRIAPFFFSGSLIVVLYGIWQNMRFLHGANSFEIMPGRPNGTFTEPDWFGIFIAFLISATCVVIYNLDKKTRISKLQLSSLKLQIAKFASYILLTLAFIVLILTVSRSAWLGGAFAVIGFLKIILTNGRLKISKWQWSDFLKHTFSVGISFVAAISIIYLFNLTKFQIASRAQSTGGLQKITIACPSGYDFVVPEKINDLSEIEHNGCRHINLEDIESERVKGNEILEIYRPDPTLNIRAQIYRKSIDQIKAHPFLGIGWGSISNILGTDERGAGLNASNIFLETWLGAGMIGFSVLAILLVYIFLIATSQFLNLKVSDKLTAAFALLGWVAVLIPNLFNSGIFLGFLWVYLGVSVSLLNEK